MLNYSILFKSVIVIAIACAAPAQTQNLMKTATVNGMRVELHVMPSEPFFTADEVTAKHVTVGMLIMEGAEPLAPDAESHPNHHLVVHIFDSKTGHAITNAKVTMSFQPLDSKGKLTSTSIIVPIVIMQAIGKGPESTHYGNNVVMLAGSYSVMVVVNGKKIGFKVAVSAVSPAPMNDMNMQEHK
jgi:hypothetical protein